MKTMTCMLAVALLAGTGLSAEPKPGSPAAKAAVRTPAPRARQAAPSPQPPRASNSPELSRSVHERLMLQRPASPYGGALVHLAKPKKFLERPRRLAPPRWRPRFVTAYDPADELIHGEPRGIVLFSIGF